MPPAPIVSSALSGFVVGVIVTLIVAGAIPHSVSSSPNPTTGPTPPVRQLGPSPDRTRPRLTSATVSPPSAEGSVFQPGFDSSLRTVVLTFRLNDHPLGPTWRLRAAKADVFLLLKALYSSNLPIGNVEMAGVFPLTTKKGFKSRRVLLVYANRATVGKLPWKRLSRDEPTENHVWRVLDYAWVDPRFAK
jgi:hypothetical protein